MDWIMLTPFFFLYIVVDFVIHWNETAIEMIVSLTESTIKILISAGKRNPDICHNVDEAWGHDAKLNKQSQKDKYYIILWVS